MPSWETIIGFEIHIELSTRSKMFCRCAATYFGHDPNTHVCPVCLGLPGALPVANKQAIDWVVLAGLAFGCQIPLLTKFDRKNYFYPDLPKGYQISQYDLPLAIKGRFGEIRIRRVHLEEDTAKLIHLPDGSLIDFNRSGVPLMEIVTEPDLRSAGQAKEFLRQLQQTARYLQISDCDMEKGSMRCEANLSLRKKGTTKLPDYKVEIKNLNSFRFVEKALDYEIARQQDELEKGTKLGQETRGWDEKKQITVIQRVKEEASDYRYFPEPDLPPIRWQKAAIEKLRQTLPELPKEKTSRFQKTYQLDEEQARLLTKTRAEADYFEEAVKVGRKHQITAAKLANVMINKRVAREKLLPAELVGILVKRQAASQISPQELKRAVIQALKANSAAVKDYQAGKAAALEFLVGQVMRITRGQADPQEARKIVAQQLKKK